jgi:hypothetical protein
MAFFACQRGMLAYQRIPRLSMIEVGPVYVSPARGIMAGSALLIELPAMNILMAIGTLVMFNAGKFYKLKIGSLFRNDRCMAFCAVNLQVSSRERECGF